MSIHFIIFVILTIIQPAKDIDLAIDFPHERYRIKGYSYGDHTFKVI